MLRTCPGIDFALVPIDPGNIFLSFHFRINGVSLGISRFEDQITPLYPSAMTLRIHDYRKRVQSALLRLQLG